MTNTEEKKKSKSFWETVPGILTALATLITAIGGCIGIFLASPRILDLILPSTATPTLVVTAPVRPTDTPLPPPTEVLPTDAPSPTATQPPTTIVLRPDGTMSLNRLIGACASGLFAGDWVDREGYRVGVSPVEDCPPPSHWTTLLTFDVSDLTGVTIVEAELDLADYQIIGDPFAEFGDLIVEEVSYAEVGAGFAVMETRLKELGRVRSAPAGLDVTQALADAVGRGSKRFQLRLGYEIEGVDFRDFDEAIATPRYYLVWRADAITLNVAFSQ